MCYTAFTKEGCFILHSERKRGHWSDRRIEKCDYDWLWKICFFLPLFPVRWQVSRRSVTLSHRYVPPWATLACVLTKDIPKLAHHDGGGGDSIYGLPTAKLLRHHTVFISICLRIHSIIGVIHTKNRTQCVPKTYMVTLKLIWFYDLQCYVEILRNDTYSDWKVYCYIND